MREVSIAPLVTLRILSGLLLAISTVRFMWLGWIDDHYVAPRMHFHYFGFEWLPVLPEAGLYAVHVLMLLAALMVMIGYFYRFAACILFLSFTYTELIDLTYYLNHYYFVSILCFLLMLVPANRSRSLDMLRKPGLHLDTVPAWTILIFRFQLALVYFYAGIAKINATWLIDAMPLRIWLPPNNHLPLIGFLFDLPFTPWLFSWAGMIYDVTITGWLLWSRSRPLAYFTVIVFHILTGILFQIGVFPIVMIAATLIFFSAAWHERIHAILFGKKSASNAPETFSYSSYLLPFLALFMIFQVVFPWRYLLYPGNMYWTEQGYRFGWRVMLMEKAGTATFFVKDGQLGREGVVINEEFLNSHQEKQMAMQPDMILQFAHFLHKHYRSLGMRDPQVRAEVYVTLNGSRASLLIDPALNLAGLEDGWKHKSWIKPYAVND
jgi:uncharacterized membrane protein YphA (DoxX/SURF4 family)